MKGAVKVAHLKTDHFLLYMIIKDTGNNEEKNL